MRDQFTAVYLLLIIRSSLPRRRNCASHLSPFQNTRSLCDQLCAVTLWSDHHITRQVPPRARDPDHSESVTQCKNVCKMCRRHLRSRAMIMRPDSIRQTECAAIGVLPVVRVFFSLRQRGRRTFTETFSQASQSKNDHMSTYACLISSAAEVVAYKGSVNRSRPHNIALLASRTPLAAMKSIHSVLLVFAALLSVTVASTSLASTSFTQGRE